MTFKSLLSFGIVKVSKYKSQVKMVKEFGIKNNVGSDRVIRDYHDDTKYIRFPNSACVLSIFNGFLTTASNTLFQY